MEHDIDMLLEIWKGLKPHLAGGDIDAAAEDFVHILTEHGISAEDLAEYALDPELKAILREYTDEEDFDEDEEELDFGDYD